MVNTSDITLEFRYRDDGSCRRISVRHHRATGKWRCWHCRDKTFTKEEYEKHIKEKHDGEDYYGCQEMDQWGFGVEPKIYLSSNHISKIDANDEGRVSKWINELMTEAKVKPVPRFSLKQHSNR